MTKLSALSKRTEYPVIIRNFIINNTLRFRSNIRKAVRYHLNTDLTLQQKQQVNIKKNISNFMSILRLPNLYTHKYTYITFITKTIY